MSFVVVGLTRAKPGNCTIYIIVRNSKVNKYSFTRISWKTLITELESRCHVLISVRPKPNIRQGQPKPKVKKVYFQRFFHEKLNKNCPKNIDVS
jgi:hypothetical protein